MEAPRDLCLTKDQVLCEFGSPESAVVFHRKGQVITPQEDLLYGVTAYLERTTRERERAERKRVLAEAKAVEFATVENKALVGPLESKPDERVLVEESPIEARRRRGSQP